MLHPILQPVLQPVLRSPFDRRPTALTIAQLLPSGAGRVAAIYSDPAKPSYDECIQKNMDAIAAGRPQDCVLFSDAAGQTPVVYPIGAGQGKGLLLDRSAGLVRGPELVINGGFDTDTAWTKGDGWAIGSGVATKTAGTASTLTPSVALTPTVSKVYEVVYTITRTAGSATVSIGAAAGAAKTASGTYTEKLLATTTDNLTISADAAFAGTIDNISVREIPGHHQQQPTASARGEFSRRYNQLTATETFESAVWSNSSGVTVAANAITAPNGTGMAVKAVESATAGEHRLAIGVTKPASAQQYTTSVYVKAAERTVLGLYVLQFGVFANRATCVVDLITGTVQSVSAAGTFSGASCTVTDAGNGWFKVELQFTSGAETTLDLREYIGDGTSLVYTGDGTSGIYIWGADLRPTADAIPSIPAYQRVTTASDYDEVGFPTYWRAVTDDWAKSHMDPNGATKAYVFWAGQKMSDGLGTLIEASANSSTTQGAASLFSLDSKVYRARSAGSVGVFSDSITVESAGHRACLANVSDIIGDICALYVNGTTATNTADQGTGAYTEQDVFFGARAGTTLFANIREYAPPTILFLQPADSLSASHLSKLQRGYAKAVGVTL